MKDETKLWLNYTEENLQSAKVLCESHLYYPCLQNTQQSVEKALKALLIEKKLYARRTHDIFSLKQILMQDKIEIDISDDECDLFSSIYIPSKYPLGSVLPDFNPVQEFCLEVLSITDRVYNNIGYLLKK
jgi:HEPN domain-containing protein